MKDQKQPTAKAVAIDFRFPFVIATVLFGAIAATLSAITIATGAGV